MKILNTLLPLLLLLLTLSCSKDKPTTDRTVVIDNTDDNEMMLVDTTYIKLNGSLLIEVNSNLCIGFSKE